VLLVVGRGGVSGIMSVHVRCEGLLLMSVLACALND
jgi:hypothetical protein